jgi:hypothetical protein
MIIAKLLVAAIQVAMEIACDAIVDQVTRGPKK